MVLLITVATLSTVGHAQDRSSNGVSAPSSSPADRLPANYRLQMANYILVHNRYVIRDAKISKPYERYGGLFRGGTFTAVCVAIFRDNPLGIVVRDNRVLTFEEGRVKEVAMGLEACSELSPFTELKPR
jgi:hypothetical protein